ncbi:BspA family leucine-rich repeat surface protein [Xylocopilactobacillus apicola]|uniref:Surface protein n=1 Tax=Xylocopilactobacillus apicola TaxID=2932184 RepID=A0AAU9D6I2_9LACO|nr:BspA family leucine-rich repeat surface protein [Xylocopilactobacillus apicola]BDR57971.1 hypothetical protein XA3_04120 [Xylocopilactobacillus apicola]
MKVFRKLGNILLVLSGIMALIFALNFKQDSKAAEFPENVSMKGLQSNLEFGNRVFEQIEQNHLQSRSKIQPQELSTIITPGNFRLKAESQFVSNQSSVKLNWDALPNVKEGYVVQRTTDGYSWTVPPTTYGQRVEVLNVYPGTSNFLKRWMDQLDPNSGQPVSMGLINVTPVSISDFNRNPNSYLKDSLGNYKYHSVYFGSEDSGGQDLNYSSYQAVAAYAETGRSLIFGHDTIARSLHPYMKQFASKLGFVIWDALPSGMTVSGRNLVGSTQIQITKDGFLTQYPYRLDPNATYNIKMAHTTGQFFVNNSGATRWMSFKNPSYNGTIVNSLRNNYGQVIGDNNHYLVTKDNYAMIQTGHTTGACTPDEAKVIANMIYYIGALNTNNSGEDHTVLDQAAPNLPQINLTNQNSNQLGFGVSTTDNATFYQYRVKANTSAGVSYSDTVRVPLSTGIKGYVYSLDSNPNGTPSVVKNSSGEVTNINLNPTSSSNPLATLLVNRNGLASNYLHVVAVDGANNVSATKTVKLTDYYQWWEYNSGTLTIYPHQLNSNVDATIIGSGTATIVKWPWDQYLSQINNVKINPGVTATGSLFQLFARMTALTSIQGLAGLDTSSVIDMRGMFQDCSSLTTLDLSGFNTANVINFYRFLRGCTNLTNVKFGPNFLTSNVVDFGGMFEFCGSLTSLDVSKFDTSNATQFEAMFSGCSKLTKLEVDRFNTSKATNMDWMFLNCHNLTTLNITNFRTPMLTSMQSTFSECRRLTTLDLSNLNVSKVNDFSYLFENSYSLTELDLSNFNIKTTADTTKMFNKTNSLWKLKLGANTKLGTLTFLGNPTQGTVINDIFNPTPVYYATGNTWREVATGSPHLPNGAIKTAAQIAGESQTRSDDRIYVWDQNGIQTLEFTPGSIDLGTYAGHLKNKEYVSASQNLKITDNRNDRSGKQWRVEAAVTKPFKHTTDPTKVISGDPLYHHDVNSNMKINLSATARTLYNGTATSGYQEIKNFPFLIRFKANPSDIPAAGTYKATVTYTLVNPLP